MGDALNYKPEGRGFYSPWCQYIFHLLDSSGKVVALWSTQPVTEMSTGNIS
jgi:hypothetical protein